MTSIQIALAALVIEAACGYPAPVFRVIKHPVTWAGALIAALDRACNRPPRARAAGVLALAVLLAATAIPAAVLTGLLRPSLPGGLLLTLLTSSLLAQRSLHQHVAHVAEALGHGLPQARAAVAHIVGRDPGTLDHAAIARAAIESLAENFSDAVVAPAFYAAILGLPGAALYKSINTADSMIGHRTKRHERFGWAAARLDDLVNLPASRLAAVWLVAASATLPGASPRAALRAAWCDAPRHRSPNAGWPEAAMAGALGLRLAGPRVYGGVAVQDAWMGAGRMEATAGDIDRALALYRRACALQIGVYAVIALG